MTESVIDSQLLETQPQFFVDEQGNSLVFHIPVTVGDRDLLAAQISQHGGHISDTPESSTGKPVLILSTFGEVHHDTYDPRLVTESVKQNRLLKLEDYKNPRDNGPDVQQLVSYLDSGKEVGSNTEAGGNDRVMDAVITARETPGNIPGSTPSEAQKQVQPQRSSNNNSAKNAFTKEEDEIIIEQVRRNPHRRSTHKLYHEIALLIGRHTGNSIRYRFTHNLVNRMQYVYKTDSNGNLLQDADGKFIPCEEMPKTMKRKFTADDDYQLSKVVREELIQKVGSDEYQRNCDINPPGKIFDLMESRFPSHSKAAWRDRFRKFVSQYGIDDYIDYYEKCKRENTTPEEIKNFTGKSSYKSKKDSSNLEDDLGSKLTEHNNQFDDGPPAKKRRTPGNYSKNAESAESTGDSTNLFIAGDQTDLHDLDFSSNYASAAVANATRPGGPQTLDFLTDDLVSPKFFTFNPPISVVEKVREIVHRQYDSTDAESLIAALYEEAGIQKDFGTFIITSVCGDLILIPKYIELFLKTQQNPPENIHGIWTSRDDNDLRHGGEAEMERLRLLHGSRRIDLRRQFISQELI